MGRLKIHIHRVRVAAPNGQGKARPENRAPPCWSSILVGEHDGDGGLGIVEIERATGGDELDQACAVVVVADVEGDGHAFGARPNAKDREAEHPLLWDARLSDPLSTRASRGERESAFEPLVTGQSACAPALGPWCDTLAGLC